MAAWNAEDAWEQSRPASARARRDPAWGERAIAWVCVAAMHLALGWGAAEWLFVPRPAIADTPLVLVLLPSQAAIPPVAAPSPEAVAAPMPATRAKPVPAPVATSTPASSTTAPDPHLDLNANLRPEPPPAGLTAVDLSPSRSAAPAPPAPPAPPVAPAAPWDAPAARALAKPFARPPPDLPGAGHERFRMKPPVSVASVVRSVGRLFGGQGPSDCAETRANIRELAVLGAEAVAQEIEEERRNCGN